MSKTRAARIDTDAIVNAALRLGLDTASTVSVARALGVEQPALYRHVTSKAQMLDLAASAAVARLGGWTPQPDWESSIWSFHDALWECLVEHRGLAGYLLTTSSIPQALQREAERLVQSLAENHLPLRQSVLAVDALVHLSCLAIEGDRRLQDVESAALWGARRDEIAQSDVLDAVRGIEATETRSLAREQFQLMVDGLRAQTRGGAVDA